MIMGIWSAHSPLGNIAGAQLAAYCLTTEVLWENIILLSAFIMLGTATLVGMYTKNSPNESTDLAELLCGREQKKALGFVGA